MSTKQSFPRADQLRALREQQAVEWERKQRAIKKAARDAKQKPPTKPQARGA